MNEDRLRAALRETPIEDAGARARAWRVVRAAYRDREPVRPARGRRWAPVLAVAACALVAVIVVASAGAPGDAVARWVRSVFGSAGEPARPALVRVPGGGRLLVSSSAGAWVVSPDGSRRRLGDYDGASWSANGRFAVVWRGGELLAVEPGGRVRWSLARQGTISVARWAPVQGYRIAYLAGDRLRVVWGNGLYDRRVGRAWPAVAPAWRPDDAYVLAYLDRRRRVRVVAVDSRDELWRSGPVRDAIELAWSPDGRRLAVVAPRRLLIYSRRGRLLARRPLPPRLVADDIAWAPAGDRLAMIRRGQAQSDIVVLDRGGRLRSRPLFTGPGRFGPLAWSPAGERLLVPWPQVDQWLFLPLAGGRASAAIGNIERQFAAGPRRRAFPHTVEWCCGRTAAP